MVKRAAVLDLGTNTFQLVIAERLGETLQFLHRDERWVNLAEDGIERIGGRALERMEITLSVYKTMLDKFEPGVVKAFGTAAFRHAANRDEASALVERLIGVAPQVLAGDEEAGWIYEGTRLAIQQHEESALLDKTVLVMDIGGGSTEFILGRGHAILWKKSFPLGATLLRQLFHKSDPMAFDEMHALRRHVGDTVSVLQEAVAMHQPVALIGASGSFESFASILCYPDESENALVELDPNALNGLIDDLVGMNEAQRRRVPGLAGFRVGPIVTASLLTRVVLERFSFQRVYRSAYALKEGLMVRALKA